MRKVKLALATAGVLALSGAGAVAATTAASASPVAVYHTVSAEHPDTTSVSGTATQNSPGGPIWGDDHLKETITVTSAGTAGHYNVKIGFTGSTFEGFADPGAGNNNTVAGNDPANYGGPLFSQGTITGNITYDDITASHGVTPPPSNEPPATGLGAVLTQILGNSNAVTSHYTVNYKQNAAMDGVDPTGNSTDTWAAGTTYTQTG